MLLLKSVLKRALSVVLTLCMILTIFSVGIMPASAEGYDPSAALAYAKAHWNDGRGQCAEFVRDCLKAGGLTSLTSINCGGLLNQIQNGGWGTLQKMTPTNGKFLYSVNREILSAGDPIIWYCHNCKKYPHVVLCGGYNSSGYITYYAHNNAHNNDTLYFNLGSSEHKNHSFTVYSIQMNSNGYYELSEYIYATYRVTAESTALRKAPFAELDGKDTTVFTSAAETILVIVGAHTNKNGVVYYKTDSGYWLNAEDVEKVEDLVSLSISGQTLPENLKKGSSFSLKGTIKSASSPITSLTAGIYYTDGETAATSKTVSPNTATASLSLVDSAIAFGKLLSGNYIYKVTAKNAFGEAELINHPFTVLGTDEIAITFDANGGECETESATYTAGVAVGELPVPNRDGYTFLGWTDADGNAFTSESLATSSMTVTAQWKSLTPTADELAWEEKLDVYAIYIVSENGTVARNVPYKTYLGIETAAAEYEAGKTVVIVASTVNYYDETWYKTEDGNWVISTDVEKSEELKPFMLSEDTNYPDKIKLAYSAYKLTGTITSLGGKMTTVNGGIFDLDGKRVYGKTVTANSETFSISTIDNAIAFRSLGVGEYYYRITATNDYGTFDVIDYQFKVVSKLPDYVTITLDANGGECDETSLSVAFKEEIGYLPTPEMKGYNFVGWYNELGDEITELTIADDDMALVAMWEEIPFVKGDTDGDGMIDSTDLLRVQQYIIGQLEFDGELEIDLDLNEDGFVDSTDLVIMQMMILSLA